MPLRRYLRPFLLATAALTITCATLTPAHADSGKLGDVRRDYDVGAETIHTETWLQTIDINGDLITGQMRVWVSNDTDGHAVHFNVDIAGSSVPANDGFALLNTSTGGVLTHSGHINMQNVTNFRTSIWWCGDHTYRYLRAQAPGNVAVRTVYNNKLYTKLAATSAAVHTKCP